MWGPAGLVRFRGRAGGQSAQFSGNLLLGLTIRREVGGVARQQITALRRFGICDGCNKAIGLLTNTARSIQLLGVVPCRKPIDVE